MPSSGSVRVFYFDREKVWAALREFVKSLTESRPDVVRVVVFGSLARGDAVPGSDVDLLIVLDSSELPFPERIARFLPTRFPVGVDVFPYTREEMEGMIAGGNTFARHALEEGIDLLPQAGQGQKAGSGAP